MNKKEKKLNYDYEVFLDGDSAAARVIRIVGNEKKVLEIGAGPGSITKHLSSSGNCDVVALEIDKAAIQTLQQHCRKVYSSDLNLETWTNDLSGEGKFDAIVAADVLEHLYNPWKTLEQMSTLLSPEGYVVLSLPHVSHAAVMACLADGDFAYSDWGLLDKTHIRFFGIKNMEKLVYDAGLKVVAAEFVLKLPEDTEFSKKWSNLTTATKNAFLQHKFSNVYQVVIKAVPKTSKESEISIQSLEVTKIKVSFQQRLIRLARKILPDSVLSKLKSILSIKSKY